MGSYLSRAVAISAVGAPLLLLASTAASTFGNGLGKDAAGGVLQIWAGALFAPVVFWMAGLLEPKMPRTSALLLLTGTLGCAGAVAYGVNSIHFEGHPVRLDADGHGLMGALGLNVPGILFPVSLAALGLLLARTRAVAPAAGYVIAAGAVLFPVSRIGEIGELALVVDLLLAAGLTAAALPALGLTRRASAAVG